MNVLVPIQAYSIGFSSTRVHPSGRTRAKIPERGTAANRADGSCLMARTYPIQGETKTNHICDEGMETKPLPGRNGVTHASHTRDYGTAAMQKKTTKTTDPCRSDPMRRHMHAPDQDTGHRGNAHRKARAEERRRQTAGVTIWYLPTMMLP